VNLFEKLPLFLRPPFPLLWRAVRATTLVLTVLAVMFVYLFLVTAGTFHEWPTYNALYDSLAQGFRSGHLYLPIEPSPELVAAENPLDPANSSLWIPDLSFYQGKFYIYWGPFPALCLWAVKALFRIKRTLGDQYPCFAFYLLFVVAGAVLITRIARRLFPGLPHTFVLMAIVVFCFASPTPYLLATPGIYEAAIGGGQAFLLVGIILAFDALGGIRSYSRLRLFLAGAAWAIALACRVSLGPAVLLVAILTAVVPRRVGNRWWNALIDLTLMSIPIVVTVGGLLVYNKARFDSWLEFGTGNQLNVVHYRGAYEYLRPNLYSYFLRKPVTSCEFPFAKAPWDMGDPAFPDGYAIPEGYWIQEPVVGMLRVVPWAWLVPLCLLFVARALSARVRSTRLLSAGAPTGARLWCVGVFATLAIVNALPFVATFNATMRYLGDVTPGFILLATIGAWSLYDAMRHRKWLRRAYGAGLAILAAGSVILGMLFGFDGYGAHFRSYNPALHEKLVNKLSHCG
jgi:hypothetical protein